MLEDSAMKQRAYRLLSSPTHISRFIEAANDVLDCSQVQQAA